MTMRRVVLLLAVVVLSLTQVDAQDKLRARIGRGPLEVSALTLAITGPTTEATLSTTGSTIQLSGTASGDPEVITWTCATCTPASGQMSGTTAWSSPVGGSPGEIFQDNFNNDAAGALTAHTPTPLGTSWTEAVDTGGANFAKLFAADDWVAPDASDGTGNRLIVTAAPDPAGADYVVSVRLAAGGYTVSTSAETAIVFGYQDSSNYCGLAFKSSVVNPDVFLFKRVAGVVTDLATGNAGPVAGNVLAVAVDGTSLTATLNGSSILTTTEAFCDDAATVGLGWGANRTAGAAIHAQGRLDDFTVVDNAGAAAGISLAVGANTISVCAEKGVSSTCDSIVVTRAGSDTTDPSIAITGPTSASTYATSSASFTPSGTATDNVGVSSVSCACATCTPTSRAATLTGDTWSTAAFTLASGANTIICTAADAAANDASDQVVATFTPADVTAPTITITTPTSGATHTATATPLTIGGTASDNVAVTTVSCVNAAGGGTVPASGTTAWTCPIVLHNGSNAITVTAADEAGNSGTDLLTVTYDATLTIVSPAALPSAPQNVAYTTTLAASGGTQPYTWDNNAGGSSLGAAACTGLSISSAGVVSGTPTTTGTCSFTSRVTDSAGSPATDTQAHTIEVAAPGDGPHDFFDALIERGDFYKGKSLRPSPGVSDVNDPYFENQLILQQNATNGGILGAGCPSIGAGYYSPGTDTDPQAQDAAKLAIPPFVIPGGCQAGHTLTGAIDDSVTKFATGVVSSTYGPPGERAIRIDDEVMDLRPCTVAEGGDGIRAYIQGTKELCVIRGQYGTAAASHALGAQVKVSGNAIPVILHIPFSTTDGNTYVITWDEFWTDSYIGVKSWNNAQKTYQVKNGGGSKLWEPRLRFDGGSDDGDSRPAGWNPATDIATIDIRSYQSDYAGVDDWSLTNGNTMGPSWVKGCGGACLRGQTGQFIVKPNTWVRFWIKVVQQADDFDLFTMWVADENNDAVILFEDVKMSVNGGSANQTLTFFDFEKGDSSTEHARGGLFDLVSYARNWAVLVNPPADLDAAGLLARPKR